MITLTLLSLLLPALVSAHGFPAKVSIDGTVYQGNSVGTQPTVNSPIRQISTNGPVKGTSNPNLNCGQSAALGTEVATANPGSTVQIYWSGGVGPSISPWPHNVGPIMHYMAKCDGSCANYNSSNAEWFKIAELGLQSDGKTWYQAQLQSGSPVTVTIPSTLASGNYLLRSEILTLQLAMTPGGAEFYPACIQLSVGGSQSGQPTSSELVTFPGGYSDSDPGILINVYDGLTNYPFPGPSVAAFVSGGSSSGSLTGSSANATTTPYPSAAPFSAPSAPLSMTNGGSYSPSAAPTASPTSTSGSGTCMQKRSSEAHKLTGRRMHKRRHRTSH